MLVTLADCATPTSPYQITVTIDSGGGLHQYQQTTGSKEQLQNFLTLVVLSREIALLAA